MLGACAHGPCPVSKRELSESGKLSPVQLQTRHTGVPETDVRETLRSYSEFAFLTEEC